MVTQYGLTPRQAMFAKAYVASGNGAEAARNAGYSEHTAKQQGSRLLTNVHVQTEIAALEAAQREDDAVDRAYVRGLLRSIAENGEKETNRLRAAELLGKSVGLFVNVYEGVPGAGEVPELRTYSLDELRALRALMVDGGAEGARGCGGRGREGRGVMSTVDEMSRRPAIEAEATVLTDAEETAE